MTNVNTASLSRQELEAEYELSQWALTWALHKLGGRMEITQADMLEFDKQGRLWYNQLPEPEGGMMTVVEFVELSVAEHVGQLNLIGVN